MVSRRLQTSSKLASSKRLERATHYSLLTTHQSLTNLLLSITHCGFLKGSSMPVRTCGSHFLTLPLLFLIIFWVPPPFTDQLSQEFQQSRGFQSYCQGNSPSDPSIFTCMLFCSLLMAYCLHTRKCTPCQNYSTSVCFRNFPIISIQLHCILSHIFSVS